MAALPVAACSSANDRSATQGLDEADEPEVVFLVQGAPATVVMEALFVGRVIRDPAGCLRLEGPDPATVVWPFGFRLVPADGGLAVRDADGQAVGRIGGDFRLGGGEVPFLHEGLALPEAERRAAETRCPGRYWIVGDVQRG